MKHGCSSNWRQGRDGREEGRGSVSTTREMRSPQTFQWSLILLFSRDVYGMLHAMWPSVFCWSTNLICSFRHAVFLSFVRYWRDRRDNSVEVNNIDILHCAVYFTVTCMTGLNNFRCIVLCWHPRGFLMPLFLSVYSFIFMFYYSRYLPLSSNLQLVFYLIWEKERKWANDYKTAKRSRNFDRNTM